MQRKSWAGVELPLSEPARVVEGPNANEPVASPSLNEFGKRLYPLGRYSAKGPLGGHSLKEGFNSDIFGTRVYWRLNRPGRTTSERARPHGPEILRRR